MSIWRRRKLHEETKFEQTDSGLIVPSPTFQVSSGATFGPGSMLSTTTNPLPDPPEDPAVTPDRIEPIVGARAWLGTSVPGGLRQLHAINQSYGHWKPGDNKAECLRNAGYWGVSYGDPDEHTPPGVKCHCGFWALPDPLEFGDWNLNGGVPPVFGVVELWGRVICGSKGWRGEHARISSIVARNPSHVRRVEVQASDTYQVPILNAWPELTAPSVATNRKELNA